MHTYIQPNPLFGSHYFHNYARKAFSFKLKQKQTTKFLNEKNVGGQTKKEQKKLENAVKTAAENASQTTKTVQQNR